MYEYKFKILYQKDLLKFSTYEDYLDSFIKPRDLFHLQSKSISRRIIELGYHTKGTLQRQEFYDRIKSIKRYLYLYENPYALCSVYAYPVDRLLQELAVRENENRRGELYTIIFLHSSEKSKSQVSAYIDYSYRLKSEDWLPYFLSSKRLIPETTDLSYYEWKTGNLIMNESKNFKPIVDGKRGLAFKNIHNSKIINTDPLLYTDLDISRSTIYSLMYGSVVFYDQNVKNNESHK